MKTRLDKARPSIPPACDEILLHAYLDGELPPSAAAEWDRRLAADPSLSRQREEILALRRLVQADSARLPPFPATPSWRAALADAAPARGERASDGVGRPGLIFLRDAFRLLLSPMWARAAAAVVALFAAAWMGVRLAPAPEPSVAAVPDGVDILSVELPQAGTGVCTLQMPGENLTVLWITGLTTPSFGGPEPTNGTHS